MAATAAASIVATLAIPANAIDHNVARGFTDDHDHSKHQPSGLAVLLACKPLMIFAACITLFHFANAAMLPLVGQKLSLVNKELGTSFMSACIVAAQLVMVPVAMLVGAKADIWGRKPIFLAGFLILPIRGVLYTLSDNPFWLVGVQTLDGIGAGIFGALFPLVVADLTRGTGRFNVSQGAITTALGIGAALSTSFAGVIVVNAGYGVAFLFLAAVATVALTLFWFAMPETLDRGASQETPPLAVPAAAAILRGMQPFFDPHLAIWSIALFATSGVIFRPWRLPEAIWAILGAAALVGLGLFAYQDALKAVAKGTDVYLFLIGMMLMAELARREGLFDCMAAHAARAAQGSTKRLFPLIYGVGVLVTVLLSTDATAVVLTPAVYAAAKAARAEPLPYLFICAFIANAASFVLPISTQPIL
jgi:MFS family permease